MPIFASLAMLASAAALLGSQAPAAQQLYRQAHNAMGTVWTLDLYAADAATATHAAQDAWEVVDRIDDELSNYKPTSELVRISKQAGSAWITTDPETFAFLERSLFWSHASDGAFDITVGPLLRVWGFFFHNGRVPTPSQLAAVRHQIGWRNVQLHPSTRGVHFRNQHPMDLDPGSIGKGFAVDRAVAQLREDGITAALLSAGGSTLYAIGAPPGQTGWPVIVPDPRDPSPARSTTVAIHDTSLSTGACTQKFFMAGGHRYCHIFNPRTLRPVEGVLQTTVIDPSATDSDALSTVAFVLPASRARRFFQALPHSRMLVFRTGPAAKPTCLAVHWNPSPCAQTIPGVRSYP